MKASIRHVLVGQEGITMVLPEQIYTKLYAGLGIELEL